MIMATAGLWLGKALDHGDDLRARASDVIDKEQLDVIKLAAELTLSMGTDLVADLPKRIEAASVDLAKRRDPTWMTYERWFEIYGPLVSAPRAATGAAPVVSR